MIKLPDPPLARPNTPVKKRVMLKDQRLPQTSQPTPQTIAPTKRPILRAKERYGGLNPNSATTGVSISPDNSWFAVDECNDVMCHLNVPAIRYHWKDAAEISVLIWYNSPRKAYLNHPKPATTNTHHWRQPDLISVGYTQKLPGPVPDTCPSRSVG